MSIAIQVMNGLPIAEGKCVAVRAVADASSEAGGAHYESCAWFAGRQAMHIRVIAC